MMSPSAIDFGGVPLGANTTETLTLTNNNSIESMVTTATTDSERFTIEDDVVYPLHWRKMKLPKSICATRLLVSMRKMVCSTLVSRVR